LKTVIFAKVAKAHLISQKIDLTISASKYAILLAEKQKKKKIVFCIAILPVLTASP